MSEPYPGVPNKSPHSELEYKDHRHQLALNWTVRDTTR